MKRSEETAAGKVSDFPACFEEHVLRRVHHSAAARVEELVTRIHNHYKLNYVPGEECMAVGPGACPLPARATPVAERERERVDLVDSHGRWKGTRLQTTPDATRCHNSFEYHSVELRRSS